MIHSNRSRKHGLSPVAAGAAAVGVGALIAVFKEDKKKVFNTINNHINDTVNVMLKTYAENDSTNIIDQTITIEDDFEGTIYQGARSSSIQVSTLTSMASLTYDSLVQSNQEQVTKEYISSDIFSQQTDDTKENILNYFTTLTSEITKTVSNTAKSYNKILQSLHFKKSVKGTIIQQADMTVFQHMITHDTSLNKFVQETYQELGQDIDVTSIGPLQTLADFLTAKWEALGLVGSEGVKGVVCIVNPSSCQNVDYGDGSVADGGDQSIFAWVIVIGIVLFVVFLVFMVMRKGSKGSNAQANPRIPLPSQPYHRHMNPYHQPMNPGHATMYPR